MSIWQDADGGLHDDAEGAALQLPSWPQGLVLLTSEQALAAMQPSPSQLWLNYQAQAASLLSESDKTILRCFENMVEVPAEWATYRKSLRGIISSVSGDPAQQLPTKPTYPQGT